MLMSFLYKQAKLVLHILNKHCNRYYYGMLEWVKGFDTLYPLKQITHIMNTSASLWARVFCSGGWIPHKKVVHWSQPVWCEQSLTCLCISTDASPFHHQTCLVPENTRKSVNIWDNIIAEHTLMLQNSCGHCYPLGSGKWDNWRYPSQRRYSKPSPPLCGSHHYYTLLNWN